MKRQTKVVVGLALAAGLSAVVLAQSFTTFLNARVVNQLDLQGTLTANGATGTAGQVLTSQGSSDVTWEDASGGGGTPCGATGQIQFNDDGEFGCSASLTWDDVTTQLLIGTGGGGSAGTPHYSFVDDPDTGMYRSGINSLRFSTGGTDKFSILTAEVTSALPIRSPTGSAAAPAYSFTGRTNQGMYSISGSALGLAVGGSPTLSVTSDNVGLIQSGSAFSTAGGMSATNPGIKMGASNSETGLWCATCSSRLQITVGGATQMVIDADGSIDFGGSVGGGNAGDCLKSNGGSSPPSWQAC